MWLPKPHPRQLPYQELQLPEPLPLPRVKKTVTGFGEYNIATAEIVRILGRHMLYTMDPHDRVLRKFVNCFPFGI